MTHDHSRLPPYRHTPPGELLATYLSLMAPMKPMLRRYGLTDQQWRVLRALDGVDLDPKQLAAVTMLNPPSLTRILKELVERGLIGREINRDDRRRSIVSVTAAGVSLIEEMTGVAIRLHRDLIDRFGRERLDALVRELRALDEVATPLANTYASPPASSERPLDRPADRSINT